MKKINKNIAHSIINRMYYNYILEILTIKRTCFVFLYLKKEKTQCLNH